MFNRAPRRLLVLATLLVSFGPACNEPRSDELILPPQVDGATGTGGSRGTSTDGPVSPGGMFTCTEDAPCPLDGKPCLVGATRCEPGGRASCVESTKFQANGSPCGDGSSVCLDGVCSPCQSGVECPLDGRPCVRGLIDCASGKPECQEAGNAPGGTACGQGQVCQAGVCGACAAGDPCLPENPCHDGILECASGVSCKDTGASKSAGSTCGSGKVCNSAGACVACAAGMACPLPTEPCRIGSIDCSSGAPTCMATGVAPNGKTCGDGKVCRDGSCEACVTAQVCTPANRCHAGSQVCASGTPECSDTGQSLANGTMCGTNQYCNNGTCSPCTPNNPCTPENRCKLGRTSCQTGVSQCPEMGNVQDGKDCGDDRVCRDGSCVDRKDRNASCNQGYECSSRTCVDSHCCNSGEKYCDGQCRPGSYCCDGTPCNIANGRAACSGGSCQLDSCNPGYERNGNQCARICGDQGEECCDGNRCNNNNLFCDRTCQPKRGDGTGCSNSNQCTNGRCTGGICCRGGTKECNGRCIDDGACCEEQCNGDRVCRGSSCECRLECCDNSDCGSGRSCQGGRCGCSGGREECNGQCVNTQSDAKHCGNCNAACLEGQICDGGRCRCREEECNEGSIRCNPSNNTQVQMCELRGACRVFTVFTCEGGRVCVQNSEGELACVLR